MKSMHGGAAFVVLAGMAFARHSQPGGPLAPNGPQLFNIQTFGVFRDLMLRGDLVPRPCWEM
jgi:hypothetical protein